VIPKAYLHLIGYLTILVITNPVYGAFRNNNHVFQLAESSVIKAELLAKQANASIAEVDIPVFQNQLPIHLYVKAIDVHNQLRQLQRQYGISEMPEQSLPEKPLRTASVYELLERVKGGLNTLLKLKGLDLPPEPEPKRGKSTEDNYAELWYLTRILSSLVPPPDTKSIQTQLNIVMSSLAIIARQQSLNKADILTVAKIARKPRAIMLLAYQNMHLLGRLQRRLEVEPIHPGTLGTGDLRLSDIYDITRYIIADLHRTRITLGLSKLEAGNAVTSETSINDLYQSFRDIHDQLIVMTGSQRL
jgi:hypothetical protein